MTLRNELTSLFSRQFGVVPQFAAFAPGRVNLIGEHTDYNEGFVLPIAVQLGVYVAGSLTDDGTVRAFSQQFSEQTACFPIGEEPEGPGWERYLGAILAELASAGVKPGGLRLFFCGDVPFGAGLSSSAAFSVSTAMLVSALVGRTWDDKVALARLCQAAENRTGVMCGLLDQMASAACIAGNAMLLDCRDLHYEMISLDNANLAIVVGDTGVKRALSDSRYNQRRAECEQAARACGVASLRDVTLADLESFRQELSEPLYRRAQHVVTENERVRRFAEALKTSDVQQAGELMSQSHASLRDDFEVSCRELDEMVKAFMGGGALGARMVGAGFGGSAIGLAEAERTAYILAEAERQYQETTGFSGDFYVVTAGSGARVGPCIGRYGTDVFWIPNRVEERGLSDSLTEPNEVG